MDEEFNMKPKANTQWQNFDVENEFTEQIKNSYMLIYDRCRDFDYCAPKKQEDDSEDKVLFFYNFYNALCHGNNVISSFWDKVCSILNSFENKKD